MIDAEEALTAPRPSFRAAFGSSLLLTIFLTHHLLNGFGGGLVFQAMDFTYRGLKVDGPTLQVLTAVARLPFSMKALMGLVSDGFPICGRRKAPYLFIATVAAVAAFFFLGFASTPSAQSTTGCLFTIFFQMALADLLVEAKYSEKVKATPERGPELLTFVSCGISVLNIISTICAGALLQNYGTRTCYLLALPFAALLLWPIARNHLEEERIPGSRRCGPDLQIWRGKGFIPFMLALASGLAALILLVCSLVIKSVTVNFLVALTLGMLNLALLSCFLRPVIAKINAFYFLQSIFHIGTHGAAFYFFTDTEESYRDGPHFSYQFYVTGMGCVAAGCSLLGAACYNLLAKKWTYRSMLMSTSLAYALANGLSVIAYKRINIKYGIPDAGFMLASSAMQTVLGQLAWMPMTVMLAQLVPQGLESVMYALLSASLSSGFAVANYGGALVLSLLGITPNGAVHEDAKFENLWIAALLSACGPCVPLFLVRILIPEGRQTDRLLELDAGSATTGSLFERLCWREDGMGNQMEYQHAEEHTELTQLRSSLQSVSLGREPGLDASRGQPPIQKFSLATSC